MMRLFDRLQVLFDHLLDNSEFNVILAFDDMNMILSKSIITHYILIIAI